MINLEYKDLKSFEIEWKEHFTQKFKTPQPIEKTKDTNDKMVSLSNELSQMKIKNEKLDSDKTVLKALNESLVTENKKLVHKNELLLDEISKLKDVSYMERKETSPAIEEKPEPKRSPLLPPPPPPSKTAVSTPAEAPKQDNTFRTSVIRVFNSIAETGELIDERRIASLKAHFADIFETSDNDSEETRESKRNKLIEFINHFVPGLDDYANLTIPQYEFFISRVKADIERFFADSKEGQPTITESGLKKYVAKKKDQPDVIYECRNIREAQSKGKEEGLVGYKYSIVRE